MKTVLIIILVIAANLLLAWLLGLAGGESQKNKSIYKTAERHKYPKHK